MIRLYSREGGEQGSSPQAAPASSGLDSRRRASGVFASSAPTLLVAPPRFPLGELPQLLVHVSRETDSAPCPHPPFHICVSGMII